MVLSKSAKVPVWGRAEPREAVTVTLDGKSAATTAGADGKWKVVLDLSQSQSGPFDMVVTGKNKVVIGDVMVGQVWLASGQSNMALTLKETLGADAEIAQSANSLLRQFYVKPKGKDAPADDVEGRWTVAAPQTSAGFTAVGYYFGKRLAHELHQPIGIINASCGGTIIETWTSAQAIDRLPSLKAEAEAQARLVDDYPVQRKAFTQAFEHWLQQTGRADKRADPAPFTGNTIAADGWSRLTLPGPIAGPGLPPNGAIWIRREIELPPAVGKLGVKIGLGRITGFPTVYWNGKKVDESTPELYPGAGHVTYFGVAPELIRAGQNVLAVRIYAPADSVAMQVSPEQFTAGPVSLVGDWQARAEYALSALSSADLAAVPKGPHPSPGLKASALFNGMIHPLLPCALAGILWYQGESNAGRAYEYRAEFPLMIEDWRTQWGRPELPFYFCQLANSLPKTTRPGSSEWAELREAQSMALRLPNTAQAVLIDLGDSADVHFRDKKDVGERLARIALARQYGRNLVYSGPVYESMAVAGNQIRINFDHTEGGLVARPLPSAYQVRSLLGKPRPSSPTVRAATCKASRSAARTTNGSGPMGKSMGPASWLGRPESRFPSRSATAGRRIRPAICTTAPVCPPHLFGPTTFRR